MVTHYSDDNDLLSLDNGCCSKLCGIRRAWNTQTSSKEDVVLREAITKTGPKSGKETFDNYVWLKEDANKTFFADTTNSRGTLSPTCTANKSIPTTGPSSSLVLQITPSPNDRFDL